MLSEFLWLKLNPLLSFGSWCVDAANTIFVNPVDTVGMLQGCLRSTFYQTALLIGSKSRFQHESTGLKEFHAIAVMRLSK